MLLLRETKRIYLNFLHVIRYDIMFDNSRIEMTFHQFY